MTVLGIVGSEAAKFTVETELLARNKIAELIEEYGATTVVSGDCHLGGIDQWAVQEAQAVGCSIVEFPPKRLRRHDGYRPRNIKIAQVSDIVVCITVKELPLQYTGMRFLHNGENFCYHCGSSDHVKSGGCWTMKYAAEKLGRQTKLIIIS